MGSGWQRKTEVLGMATKAYEGTCRYCGHTFTFRGAGARGYARLIEAYSCGRCARARRAAA